MTKLQEFKKNLEEIGQKTLECSEKWKEQGDEKFAEESKFEANIYLDVAKCIPDEK